MSVELKPAKTICWPHAPSHSLIHKGTYFVTCGTYLKRHHFKQKERLDVLHRGLLAVAAEFNWQLEAWAVFSNHYHFVAHSPHDDADAATLSRMLKKLHGKTAVWVNKLDLQPGRQVWHNYRETKLTNHASYLVRLNYTHQNAVKHGLVHNACAYPWCSAGWFERTASQAQQNKIYGLKIDQVKIYDEFEPQLEL